MSKGTGDHFQSGWVFGGRDNKYNGDFEEKYSRTKKPSETEDIDDDVVQTTRIKPPKRGGFKEPPGAFSYAYSFVPQQQYPPPPAYPYGYPPQMTYGGGYPPQMTRGHGYYGGYQHGQGYHGQFLPPNQGGYNYGMSHNYGGANMNMGLPDGRTATGAPVYGHGQHDYNHGGAHVMDKGLPAAANGHGQQHDSMVKHAHHHDHSHGGAHVLPVAGGAAAAADGAAAAYSHHGQRDTVKHTHEHNQCAGHMAMGGASAAATASAAVVYSHGG